jgi:hypothetical protein
LSFKGLAHSYDWYVFSNHSFYFKIPKFNNISLECSRYSALSKFSPECLAIINIYELLLQ